MHRPFRIRSIMAVSSAHPSKSKPASVTVSVAAFPVTVVPVICNTSAPQARMAAKAPQRCFRSRTTIPPPCKRTASAFDPLQALVPNARRRYTVEIVEEDQERICRNVIEKHRFQHIHARVKRVRDVQKICCRVIVKDVLQAVKPCVEVRRRCVSKSAMCCSNASYCVLPCNFSEFIYETSVLYSAAERD